MYVPLMAPEVVRMTAMDELDILKVWFSKGPPMANWIESASVSL